MDLEQLLKNIESARDQARDDVAEFTRRRDASTTEMEAISNLITARVSHGVDVALSRILGETVTAIPASSD